MISVITLLKCLHFFVDLRLCERQLHQVLKDLIQIQENL